MIRNAKLVLIIAALLALTLTGCGDNKKSSTTGSSSSSATTASTATTAVTGTTAAAVASEPTSVPPTNETSHLVAVRVGAHGAGDQVTFEFDKGVPGYSVTQTKSPVLADASGEPINVNGTSVTHVVFASASDVDLTGGLTNFYNGPKRFTPPGTNVVTELVQTGDFEARLGWAIGTKTQVPVAVTTVASPPQVILTFG